MCKRLEPFESLLQALHREVREETGLQVQLVHGKETYLTTNLPDSNVECIEPFAVYQTIRGNIDSMGVYFRCTAKGELLKRGDGSLDAQWVDVWELNNQIIESPESFSWVDLAGLKRYLSSWKNEY
nr:NUDIX hydrolase [Marininema mesophilum]